MFYVYENHINGGLVVLSYKIEDTYCDICLDSDKLIREFNTEQEAIDYVQGCELAIDHIKNWEID